MGEIREVSPPSPQATCKGSPSTVKDGDEVVKGRSSGSLKRRSTLLTTKSKSRLMSSGFLERSMDEEEDDPLLEEHDPLLEEILEDLSNGKNKDRSSVWVFLAWFTFTLSIAAGLVCTLKLPSLRNRTVLGILLWNWEVFVFVLIGGKLLARWIIKILVYLVEMNVPLRERIFYYMYGGKLLRMLCG